MGIKVFKNVTYLLTLYLSVIRIQLFYVHSIWLLVVMPIFLINKFQIEQ
jgi:hypothetical protein